MKKTRLAAALVLILAITSTTASAAPSSGSSDGLLRRIVKIVRHTIIALDDITWPKP